jgi:hypothetical protein
VAIPFREVLFLGVGCKAASPRAYSMQGKPDCYFAVRDTGGIDYIPDSLFETRDISREKNQQESQKAKHTGKSSS